MDPTGYTHAGQTIMASWNQYLEKKDEASLQIVIATIKELKPLFSTDDLPIFQNIRTTIKAGNLGLTELDKTVVEIAAKLQPEGLITQLPQEIMPFLLPYGMSKEDFHSMSLVRTNWNKLSREPARLAQMINHPQFELPLDVLLQFLSVCGPQVHTLDFYRLLSESDRDPSLLTPEKLKQILSFCPNAQNVYFHIIASLSKEILLDHFTSTPACNAVRKIGVLGFHVPGSRVHNCSWIFEADEELPKSCPNLKKISFIFNQGIYERGHYAKLTFDACPPGLRYWLKKGKDFFTFMELNESVWKTLVERELTNPSPPANLLFSADELRTLREVPLASMLYQPDWFFKITPEHSTLMRYLQIQETLISLTPYRLRNPLDFEPMMVLLEQFFELPHAAQNRLLDSNDNDRKLIVESIRAGKSWQEIVASLQ